MKTRLGSAYAMFVAVSVALPLACEGEAPERKPLNEIGQKEFLSRRAHDLMRGSFDSNCSLLYAVDDVAIHTLDEEVNKATMDSAFADFYKPTWRELFDTIALQTKSSWKYDSSRNFWVFSKPATPKPFSITLAEEWVADDRGLYVSYKSPGLPVGMDVYCLGECSADDKKNEANLFEQVRDDLAMHFAKPFKNDVTISEMRKVSVAGVEALYFQTAAPRPGVTWRQWVFIKGRRPYLIVSSLPEDLKLVSDVKTMVGSFRVSP